MTGITHILIYVYEFKVKRLMNEDVIKETSKFLTEAFEKRQVTLYRN